MARDLRSIGGCTVNVDITRPVVLTDAGNAELFASEHGSDLRWVPQWGTWMQYDGKRWVRMSRERVIPLAIKTARGFYKRAAEETDDEKRKAYVAHAKAMESAGRLEAMMQLARGFMTTEASEFDRDPNMLNVANGTLDLRGDGDFKPHRREDLLSKLSPVSWDQTACAPNWLSFLERVLPDPTVREWLQRFIGYSLTGDVGEQQLAFLHGGGANGKSTLIETVMHVLGDYAKAGAPDLLIVKAGEAHPTEFADLQGARLVVCQETEAGRQWAEAAVKRLTGGDRIKARFMRCDFFEFDATHKLIVSANHKPKVRGADEGMWRRICLVPFEVTIPKPERDPMLMQKLRAEAAGILVWCIVGWAGWRKTGLGTAHAITAATDEYRADQDHLGQFVTEHCAVQQGAFTPTKDLYARYTQWCANTGTKPWQQDTFGDGMEERKFERSRTKHARGFKDIRLL